MAKQVKKNFNVLAKAKGLEQINWRNWQPLQNDGLKDLTEVDMRKLQTSIIRNGFSEPFFIWYEKPDKGFIIGGKHRQLALIDLADNGYTDEDGKSHTIEIPELLPAVVFDFKNKKEAAQAVLTFSAKYAKETQEGLYEFMNIHNLNIGELTDSLVLPTIDLNKFEAGYFEDKQPDETHGGGASNLTDNSGPAPVDQYGVIVICENEAQQKDTYEKLKELGYICKVVIT